MKRIPRQWIDTDGQFSRTTTFDNGEYEVNFKPNVNEEVEEQAEQKDMTEFLTDFADESVKDGAWMFRSSGKERARGKPYYASVILDIFVITFAIVSTIVNEPISKQAILYIASAVLFFVTDPFDIFKRWVSLQSRIVVLIDSGTIYYIYVTQDFDNILIPPIIVWLIVSSVVCFFKNSRWIISNNWKYTSFVDMVKNKFDNDMIETAESSWQGHGKRESRTLFYELGFTSINDDVLDLFLKNEYLLAFNHGIIRDYNDFEDDVAEYEEQIEALKEEKYNLITKNRELNEEYSKLSEKWKQSEKQAIYLRQQIGEMREEHEKEIEELQKKIPKPKEADEELDPAEILQLNKNGLSIVKIAEKKDTTKYQVEKALKEARRIEEREDA